MEEIEHDVNFTVKMKNGRCYSIGTKLPFSVEHVIKLYVAYNGYVEDMLEERKGYVLSVRNKRSVIAVSSMKSSISRLFQNAHFKWYIQEQLLALLKY